MKLCWVYCLLPLFLLKVAVGQQPSLVSEPKEVEKSDGDEAVLECKFDGPAVECVWLKDGQITIVREPYAYVGSPDTGDCSVRISRLDLARDDGLWQCQFPRVGNFPAVISREARVTVLVPPEDPVIFFDGVVVEKGGTMSVQRLDENVTVVCLSNYGNPASFLYWMVEGQRFEGDARNESTVGPNNLRVFNSRSELAIAPGPHLRGSQIKCVAEHPTYHGVLHESYANILVHHNTTHVSATVGGDLVTSVEVTENEDVTVYCTADGVPEPTYTWEFQKRGADVWEILGNRQNLTFAAVSGTLFCRAGNEYNVEDVRSFVDITVETKGAMPKGNDDASTLSACLHLVLFVFVSTFFC